MRATPIGWASGSAASLATPTDAVVQYRAALKARPGHPTAAFNLGTALEDLGRWSEAIGAYRKALDADGDFADAHFNLAQLYQKTGQPAAAKRAHTARPTKPVAPVTTVSMRVSTQ